LADFPVNFIKQFISDFFWSLQNFIIKIPIALLFTLHLQRILHIISRKCWYSMQINI